MTDPNLDIQIARRFHNATKYHLVGGAGDDSDILMGEPPNLGPAIGEQDPALEPLPYKVYTTLESIPLPRPEPTSTLAALDALAASGDLPIDHAIPNLAGLARLCLRSNGLLKTWRNSSGREWQFRAAGCTGARYHLELYVACADLPDLAAGLYHYAAHDHTLRLLRPGDHRAHLVEATGHEPAIAAAPVVIALTSTFWRNAWRYQERTYRHVYWDAATLLANLVAVATDAGLPTTTVLGFADQSVNALLDVDGEREAAILLVAVGRATLPSPATSPIAPLNLPTQPLSPRQIDFPAIAEMHRSSSLASGESAAAWRALPLRRTPPPPTGETIPLRPLPPAALPTATIDEVILRRRSNRHYAAETPLPFPVFSTVLDRAVRPLAIDALDPAAPPLYDLYLIVNNVESLEPGLYVLHADRRAVELLSSGDHRAAAARLAVDQSYAADAQVNAYTLTDLAPVLATYGNRGYRLAQLEGALLGAKLQLAAHALGLGAVGLTSGDDDVIAHFSPHAAGKDYMFIAIFGPRRLRAAE